MNKFFYFFLFWGMVHPSFALNSFKPQNEWISFNGSVPPALIYVTDPNGNRAGADISLSVDQFGQQGDKLHGLEEIPGSVADQENIENDITNQPSKHTSWDIKIPDGGAQIYTVNILGVVTGSGHLFVNTGVVGKPKSGISLKVGYLTTAGLNKQFTVSYQPTQNITMVQPVVVSDGLLSDIQSACAQNLIERRECGFLEDKAKRIQEALNHHRDDEAKELLRSFLCNLGELKGDRDDDRNCRDAIKEPALTVLKDDANALLKTLPHDDHYHDR